MKNGIDTNLFELYPISELTQPKDNCKVCMKRYWIVYNDSVLRFKRTNSWQCNSLKELIDNVVKDNPIYNGCEVVYFEYLYLPG